MKYPVLIIYDGLEMNRGLYILTAPNPLLFGFEFHFDRKLSSIFILVVD